MVMKWLGHGYDMVKTWLEHGMAQSLKDGEALKVHHFKCLETEVHYDCIIHKTQTNKICRYTWQQSSKTAA